MSNSDDKKTHEGEIIRPEGDAHVDKVLRGEVRPEFAANVRLTRRRTCTISRTGTTLRNSDVSCSPILWDMMVEISTSTRTSETFLLILGIATDERFHPVQ